MARAFLGKLRKKMITKVTSTPIGGLLLTPKIGPIALKLNSKVIKIGMKKGTSNHTGYMRTLTPIYTSASIIMYYM